MTLEDDARLGDIQRIVVDTNIFYTDLLLQGSVWRRLGLLRKNDFVALFIPEIVVREMVRHFGERQRGELNEVIDHIGEIRRLKKAAASLGVSLTESGTKALRRIRNDVLSRNDYELDLRTKLQDAQVTVLPLPSVEVQDLVDAYISHRKPFKTTDAGIADYLIWQSVLSLANEEVPDARVVFLTNNTKDFSLNNDLHPDLSSQVDPRAQVVLCTTAEALLEAHEEHFGQIEDRDGFDFFDQADQLALSALTEYITDQLIGSELNLRPDEAYSSGIEILGLTLPNEVESSRIRWIDFDEASFDWQPYEVLGDTTELGVAEIRGAITIGGDVYRSEAFFVAEAYDAEMGDFDVDDDYYAELSFTYDVLIRVNIRVELNNRAEVQHLERIALD